ncbi:MAG: O-antigen ligase family protein [Candidatus Veblenbacteria bacterium]|nr:O-antigen ligase family protein [Candidatus Veblenbacteria bacterium]MDZ4229575.1 O-antigen ligase family protein [Candidatus Veblenbacteria bacterium]
MTWSVSKIQEHLFYLLVFLLPWQTRYIFYDPQLFGGTWEYGRLSVYGWDILLVLLVVWLWPRLRQEFILAFRTSRSFYFFLLLVSLGFLTGAWATEPLLVSYWGLRLLEGGALWLIVRALKPKLSVVFWSLTLAGILQAVWGLAQFSSQIIAANKWLGVAAHPVAQGGTSVLLNEGGRWLRAYGGQVHPNVLGGLLVITSLATAWLITKASTVRQRYVLITLYVLQLGGLFVTFSRAGWLALFASLAAGWWLVRESRAASQLVIVVTALVFVIMGAILWQPTKARLVGASTSRLEQQAIEERVTGIRESKSLLANAWWHGVGLGNYTAALAEYQPGLRAYRYQPVHNIFLLVLTELGIVGLLLLLWFAWRRLREYNKSLLVFLVPILVTSLFDHYWWTSASMLLLFCLIIALGDQLTSSTAPDRGL